MNCFLRMALIFSFKNDQMISFQFPAVLHVKMWFGKRSEISTWNEFIEPAEPKFFIEVFQNQVFGIFYRKIGSCDY